MSTDTLWTLHAKIDETLAAKLLAEKTHLDKLLRRLKQRGGAQPSETWAGRGKQPRGSAPTEQGFSVALSPDGNTAIVGGFRDVWVFTRSGGNWTQQEPNFVGSGTIGTSTGGRASRRSHITNGGTTGDGSQDGQSETAQPEPDPWSST